MGGLDRWQLAKREERDVLLPFVTCVAECRKFRASDSFDENDKLVEPSEFLRRGLKHDEVY